MKNEALAAFIVVTALVGVALAGVNMDEPENDLIGDEGPFNDTEVKTFSSSQEMKSYFERAGSSGFGGAETFTSRDTLQMEQSVTSADAGAGGYDSSTDSVERYSETNNQEADVQEPDILKTDGRNFYYSPEQNHYGIMRTTSIRPPEIPETPDTSVFSGLETNFSETVNISENGEMLLSENLLTFQTHEGLKGYDVSEPEEPEKEWELELNGSIVASRQINDSIILVLRENVDYRNPCPVPLASGSDSLTVECEDIGYLPSENHDSDSTYTAVEVSENGEIEQSTSIAGSTSNTVVYVSEESLYITNQRRMSELEIMSGFLEEDGDQLFTDSEMDRINEVLGYDISDRSKMIELRNVFDSHTEDMDEEQEDEWRENFENELGNYTSDNKRIFSSTAITEIGLENMEVDETGSVPGYVNDQFSMDERDGRLRIATTVGVERWGIPGETANDMYVLDENLEEMGSVQDMGITERIHSARFIDDKAYIVTFRRVDPFHVIDLSDPENPELKGELKLPGFSSYLHQLDENRILGIGEEDGKVKAVVFNVENDEPTIEDSKVFEDYSSEINQNHHAFMLDRKHKVFFLPGDDGGYIYSYADGLEKQMELEIQNPKRARYVNDHLYVFGDYSVSVIDEENWEQVKEVSFREEPERDDGTVYFDRKPR